MGVDCFKCQFFKITWDQNNPRACSAYGFKSRQLPSIVVKQSSNMDCLKFSPKSENGGRK